VYWWGLPHVLCVFQCISSSSSSYIYICVWWYIYICMYVYK
jgi:hypothetical protein